MRIIHLLRRLIRKCRRQNWAATKRTIDGIQSTQALRHQLGNIIIACKRAATLYAVACHAKGGDGSRANGAVRMRKQA